jgi:hypothetical protein
MKHTYEELKTRAVWHEFINGRRVRRQKTFTATVNPWNVNEDGTIRTRRQVYESLSEKARAWEREHEAAAPERPAKGAQPAASAGKEE